MSPYRFVKGLRKFSTAAHFSCPVITWNMSARPLKTKSEVTIMCCNNNMGFCNNNNWWWIIILILLFCNCGGNGGYSGCGNGCGGNWNSGCGCDNDRCC